MDCIKVIVQIGDQRPIVLGTVEVEDEDTGEKVLHATASLMRYCANVMDDMTTLHEINVELDRRTQ